MVADSSLSDGSEPGPTSCQDEVQRIHLAGKLLVHLAKTISGERHIFPKEQELIQESFSVDTGSQYFRSYHLQAVRMALESENLELVEMLLAKDADGNLLKDEVDLLPLAIAGSEMESAITGDTMDRTGRDLQNPFRTKWETRRRRDASHISIIVKQLLSHGAPLNGLDGRGRSALYFACFGGLPRTFELLITAGAKIDTLHDPITELSSNRNYCTSPSAIGKVNLLRIALDSRFILEGLDHDCEPWMYDWLPDRTWPFSKKSLQHFDSIIIYLLDAGMECSASDPALVRFFHMSCFEGRASHVEKLLKYGVDVNATNDQTYQDRYGTGLHSAVARGNADIVWILIANGADPKIKRHIGPNISIYDPDEKRGESLRIQVTPIHYALFNADQVPCSPAYHRLDLIFQCCVGLMRAGASDRDAEMLLLQTIVTGRMALAHELIKDGVRKSYIYSTDLTLIELFLEVGINFDYRAYQLWVISFARRHPNALGSPSATLNFLVEKSAPLLPKQIIGEISISMLEHDDILEHLIKNYDIDVNELFQINHDYEDSANEEFQVREVPTSTDASSFNLLQMACSKITLRNVNELRSTIQLLLERGARVDCPGLPKTAIEYLQQSVIQMRATEDNGEYEASGRSFELSSAKIARLLLSASAAEAVSTGHLSISSKSGKRKDPSKVTWKRLSELLQLDVPVFNPLASQSLQDLKHINSEDQTEGSSHKSGHLSDYVSASIRRGENPLQYLHCHLASISGEPKRFEYQPLRDLQSIRLIALEPAKSFKEPISCQIYHSYLAEAQEFEALSYVWGETSDLVPILLNGQLMNITKNLWCFLCRLRNDSVSRILWVDSLSINQKDAQEKSHQVQMMREIYIAAGSVAIWLGEDDEETHHTLQRICERGKAATSSEESADTKSMEYFEKSADLDCLPDHAVSHASWSICRRPWFYRIWTLQELVLAREATLILGHHFIKWEELCRLVHFTPLPFRSIHDQYSEWQRDVGQDIYRTPYSAIRGVNEIGHLWALQKLTSDKEKQENDLHDRAYSIFKYTAVCDASDPRDKVYGLLGMFERPLISVDYTLSAEEIYRTFTEAFITETQSLHVLHMFGASESISTLPSWVPDYSITRRVGTLPRAFCEERESYSGELQRAKQGRLKVEFRGDCLITRGRQLCGIKNLGDALPADQAYAPGTEKFKTVIRGWEEIILGLDTSKSPVSTLEVFMRTITACEAYDKLGSDFELEWEVSWYQAYGSNLLYNSDDTTFHENLDGLDMMAWTMPPESYLKRLQLIIDGLNKRIECVCYGRSLFVTDDGNTGLAPSCAQPGDLIVLLPNTLYPFVVRHHGDGRTTLIGDCFHYDISNGTPTFLEDLEAEHKGGLGLSPELDGLLDDMRMLGQMTEMFEGKTEEYLNEEFVLH